MLSIIFISSSFATCFIEAGNYYGINPYILYAIAKVESGLNPYAVEVISKKKLSVNCPYKYKNGKYHYSCTPENKSEAVKIVKLAEKVGANYSLGLGQINKIWIRWYKLNAEKLFDGCYNIYWSAYILNECYNLFGNSWKTVDCYNKGLKAKASSDYVLKIYRELGRLIWRDFK